MAVLVLPHKLRVGIAFWILGLINNVLYVIILSAALDLVGPTIPKGVVLLADIFPSVLVKLIAPYFIHVVPYSVRVVSFVTLSTGGMLLVALSPASREGHVIAIKLLGVALASLSSGGGELSFLGLTHFYGHVSLASWSSGTGGAGLLGAGAYVVATSSLGLSSATTLLAFSFLPVIMLVGFFLVLPERQVSVDANREAYQAIPADEQQSIEVNEEEIDPELANVSRALLGDRLKNTHAKGSAYENFKENLTRTKSLFIPYMLPLLLVYIAEYTINQGVAPTLLFPLRETPFRHFRDFYPAYNAIYQLGVFISRSSSPFVRIHNLYAPSLLQIANLALLTLHALFGFLPNVWVIFAVVFWEGLLGGLVYVNTFSEIRDGDRVPDADKEFALSATAVSDSGGVCIAALVSMAFEKSLCDWQVARGRDWCRIAG